jgi:SecY interacting protein Syd
MDALTELLSRFPRERVEHDPEWTSPCEVGPVDDEGTIAWEPVRQSPPADLSAVEAALGEPMHPDVHRIYATWYAGPVADLMLPWNAEDAERKVRGILEHLEARRGLGPPSIPIAWTDSDLYHALDNRTGAVQLEEPGRPGGEEVAGSLDAWLAAH